MEQICAICNKREAVTQVVVSGNGKQKTLNVCMEDFRKLGLAEETPRLHGDITHVKKKKDELVEEQQIEEKLEGKSEVDIAEEEK